MRQNVPLRQSGSEEPDTDRASRSIDEWLDAAVKEQTRRAPASGEGTRLDEPQLASSDVTQAVPQTRPSAATAAKSSTALNSMSSWIERAQEELAEVARAPSAGISTPYAPEARGDRHAYDALSAVERLDTSLSPDRSRSEAETAQEEAFRSLEARIREIAGRLDTPRAPARKTTSRTIEEAVVEIRARQAALDDGPAAVTSAEEPAIAPAGVVTSDLASAPSRPTATPARPAPASPRAAASGLREPSDTLAAIRADIDRLAGSPKRASTAAIPPGLESLKLEIDRVHGSMATLATRTDLGAIERSIGELAQEIADAKAHGGSLAPVEIELDALQAEVQRLAETGRAPSEALTKLARDIDIVSHKLDIVAASGIDAGAIEALSEQVAEVKRMLGGMAMPSDVNAISDQLNELKLELARVGSRQIDTQDFTSLRLAFEEMRDALSAAPGFTSSGLSAAAVHKATKDELQPIASMLIMLIEKIERLERSSGDPEILEQIERQIAGLSATIGTTASRDPALTDLSHAMNDLMNEVTNWRDGTIDIAERAARNAVAQTIQAMRAEFGSDAQHGMRARQMDEGAAPLRLAPEEPVEHAALPAEPAPLEVAAPGPDERSATGPTAEQSDASLRRLNEALLLSPALTEADRPLGQTANNEVLLEPGAGRPHSPTSIVSDEQNADDQRDIKASFIAAARRAAQAAAADADKSKNRSAERPAPTEARQSPVRIRAMLDRLRRPLLVSAAALVVAIGGYRLLAEIATTDQGDQLASIVPAPGAPSGSAPVIAAEPSTKLAAAPAAAELQDPTTTASLQPPRDSQATVPAPAMPVTERTGSDARSTAAAPAPSSVAPSSDAASQKQVSQLPPANPTNAAKPDAAAGIPAALRQAAGNGDPAALYELAVRTLEGRGVQRDPKAAVALFEKAGEKNLAPAQYRVANAYEKGIGVARDVETARRWYQRAADNGNTRAMHNLAVLMAEGAGGKPDYAAALSWFQKAAERGVRDSQFNLAVLFARGLGVQQDLVRSYTWFAVAAGQGDEEAGRKRDEVGARLQPADLARAKSTVERWRPTPSNPAANEPPATSASFDGSFKASNKA